MPLIGKVLVQQDAIAENSVTAIKIAGNAVAASEIAANAVGSSEIASDAVTNVQLSSAALSSKTMSGTVTFSGIVNTQAQTNLGDGTGDNTIIAGRLGIQDTSPPQLLHIDEVAGFSVGTGSSTTVTEFVLDSFSATTFRTAKYLVQITNTTDGDYQALEIVLFHDGSTVYLTQYASIFDNGAQATFDADISGGSVRLLATPAAGDVMSYKFIRQTIEV